MSFTRKLFVHFRSGETDWRSETFGGVVVAMVAFLCASLLITIAVVPIIEWVVDGLLVVGAVSSVYGFYSAWRTGCLS
jgi:hypothetical protein